jgi:signal transduction histidine kinase
MAVIAAIASYLAIVHREVIPFNQDDPSRVAAWIVLAELGSAATIAAGAWAMRAQHPHAAIGLAVASIGVLLPFWATWSWLAAPVRAGVLASTPLAVAGVTLVALRWRMPPSKNGLDSLRAVSVLAVAASAIHLLGYNPLADPGCARVCDDVRPVLDGFLTTSAAAALTSELTLVAIAVAVAAILRANAPRIPRPVVIAALCSMAALAMSTGLRWITWEALSPPAWRLPVEPLAVALVGATVCILAVRTMRLRAAVARLVVGLSEAEKDLGAVGGAIREVQFAVPGLERWVDARGDDVSDLTPRGHHTILFDEDGPVLRLLFAERADPIDVLAGLTPASRLALMNARLTAVARARLFDVQRSQRRIVATADAERRRIERDLHDGAQQRLVGAAFHMKATHGDVDAAGASRLTRAEAHLRTALAQLRQVAHGIVPNALFDEGLEAAIDELASVSSVPITYEVHMPSDVGSEVAMAAYSMIVAVLDSVATPATEAKAHVSVLADDAVTIRVEIEGVDDTAEPQDFTDVVDRIGAVGGHFIWSSINGDKYVAVGVIPCAP